MPQARHLRYTAPLALAIASAAIGRNSLAQRSLGIDVSDWQGNITQANWNLIHQSAATGGGGRDFAFIRSSRGGTTGFYNESDAGNANGLNTLSQRYDDTKFVQNMTRASAAGMFVGPYHFGRADIIATTLNSGGIANTGVDEANHMLAVAGNYMKPGYLRPVFDLEAGAAERTRAELTQFAVDFATTIYNAKGIYPLCYSSSSYATDEVNSGVTIMPLWLARWPNQNNPSAIDVQNIDPPATGGYPNAYGVWNPSYPSTPNPAPWQFWQYASTGVVPGISGNCDIDVAHGGTEFLKDFLVPAIWQPNADGAWTAATNWNSNPGLPSANDRVIIDRSAGNYLVTLSSGTQSVRSLFTNERLTVSGASLTIQQYAQLNNVFIQSAGVVSSGSLINNNTFIQSDGSFTTGAATGAGSLNFLGGAFTATSIKQASIAMSSSGYARIAQGANSTSVVGSLTIADNSKLDLNDNSLVVDYFGATPADSLRSMLQTAYGTGAWDGNGLTSSTAAAASGGATKTALGFAEAFDFYSVFPATFQGQSVDSTSLLVRYTLMGDATLDRAVNSADFNLLASNFGQGNLRWSKGDFNYDGTVNSADFNLLASNFGKTLASTPGASVPEPALFSGLASLGLILSRRTRKKATALDS